MLFFTYKYRAYQESKIATFASNMLTMLQKVSIIFVIGLALVCFVDPPQNVQTGYGMLAFFAVLYLILRFKKQSWTDKLAQKYPTKEPRS